MIGQRRETRDERRETRGQSSRAAEQQSSRKKSATALLRYCATVLSFLLLASSLYAQTSLMEKKLMLEKSIQGRTERIVEKIIGSKEMVVLTTVELVYEEPVKGPVFPGAMRAEEEYLPGITFSYVPFGGRGTGGGSVVVRRVTVMVTLPLEVGEDIVARIRNETSELLGLDPIRGDAVNIAQIAFSRPERNLASYFQDYSRHLYWLFLAVLLTLFLFGPVRHFFKTVVKAMELKIEADTRIRSGEVLGVGAGGPGFPLGGPMEITLDRKRPQLKEGEQNTMKRFSFINENNLKNLIFLLRTELPETIAVIISYLPQHLASLVLKSLSHDYQAEVAMNLSTTKALDPVVVDAIEGNIKARIDYLLGGEENILQILDTVDSGTQESILRTLEQKSPALAAKLKNQLFFFEDLVVLDKTSTQKMMRECQKRQISLALALKNASDEIKAKIMDTLTEGAKAMLAEQIDLLGEVAEKRIMEERKLVEAVVKELEKNGDIVIDRSKKQKQEKGFDIVTRT